MKTLGAMLVSSFFTVSASTTESLIYLSVVCGWTLIAYRACRRPDGNAVFRAMGNWQQRKCLAHLYLGARTKFCHPSTS